MDYHILDDIIINKYNGISIKKSLKYINLLFNYKYENITLLIINDRLHLISIYNNIVKCIKNKPVIEQRSLEWYNMRKNMITASDFAQAIGKGKFGSSKQFYRNKCGYEENTFNSNMEPLQWGIRYEQVATKMYEFKSRTKVTEFGLIQHDIYDFLGASPDGINNLGIMLEIKCPWKRVKTETIPEQYEIQIQGQLEVCNLEECDYFECYITEYSSYEVMIADDTIYFKGIVYRLKNETYDYGEINDLCVRQDSSIERVYMYGIRDTYLQRVYRSKKRINEIIEQLKCVWDKVLLYRSDRNLYMKDNEIKKRAPKLLFRQEVEQNM
jgi:putative phage-type endonuclease